MDPLDLDGDVDLDSAEDRPARARKTTETQANTVPPPYDPDTT